MNHRCPACLLVCLLTASAAPAQALVWLPTDDMTVYYCTSKLSGTFPNIGPCCHASVVFCPAGQLPVIYRDGQYVSNPCCIYCGTQPSKRGFLVEKERVGVKYERIDVPASVVLQRIQGDRRRWWLLLNNCQQAARRATRQIDSDEVIEVEPHPAPPPP
jgi:hypothetical protein